MVMTRGQQVRKRKVSEGEVAFALLHSSDLYELAGLELCDLPLIQERARNIRALFAEGVALQAVLVSAAHSVLGRLPSGDVRVDRIRTTLEGVMRGQSIAQIARQNSRTREYWSRSYWKQAVELVAKEMREAANARTLL
jgi:hypothetical protein